MARLANRLNARKVATAGAGMHADGHGLYLKVGESGSRSWVFRYRANGGRHDMGLGPANLVSLGEARDRAQQQRRLLRLEKKDPLVEKRVGQLEMITFEEAAEQYVRSHQSGWRNATTARDWWQSVRDYALPVLGKLPVAAIVSGHIICCLEPIWNSKTTTASRLRGRIEAILDWATARGYRTGENPARWRANLEHSFPKTSRVRRIEHHAAMPYPEVAAFLAELRHIDSVVARALEFAILTASRAGEVIGARWSEFDLENRVWTVPPLRIKSGREHRVPLSDRAVEIVQQMAAVMHSDFVFPGRDSGGISKTGFFDLLRQIGAKVTAHGFRATFRTWAEEQTSYPNAVVEMALAHQVGSAVERSYQRSDLFDRRRRLMDEWARFCAGIPTGDVVPMRGRA